MRTRVKRFNFGGAFDAMTKFGKSDLGAGITEGMGGLTQSLTGFGNSYQSDGTGNVNSADATPQDLLNSKSGGVFNDALNKRKNIDAGVATASKAIGMIPGLGPIASGAIDGFMALKGALTSTDEFGISKGQYRRSSDLTNGKETFYKGRTNAAINDINAAGAQNAFNTPKFQTPAFGKFGMKLRRFR